MAKTRRQRRYRGRQHNVVERAVRAVVRIPKKIARAGRRAARS